MDELKNLPVSFGENFAGQIKPAEQEALINNSETTVDLLIIGQGVCGTFLSWYAEKAGLSFKLIDEYKKNSSSNAAAGVINPVTGRRIVKTWMIDELLPFVWDAYQEIGEALNISCIAEKTALDFFPTPQMRIAFLNRQQEDAQYLFYPQNENDQLNSFNYDFGYGEIKPCLLANLSTLLGSWRSHLSARKQLIEEHFDIAKLRIDETAVQYQDIIAHKIIFCDGTAGFDNPFFKSLPFAPNKGEALVVEIKGLSQEHIYKRGLTLVPLKNEIFWVGSSYAWNFDDDQPTVRFRKSTEQALHDWLKMPFKTIDHFASIRPATLERRPFVGFHPIKKNIGILNGMGSKGCSLAPFFAQQMINNICNKTMIAAEADISRFSKTLVKNMPAL